MTSTVERILSRSDRGHHPGEIAAALQISPGRVYTVLRQHRPKRDRKPRRRVSDVPDKVCRLVAKGLPPARVAFLLGVSRQYVYKILG